MKLIHRIGYFSVGLFFGIILLLFFLGGKRASCDYTPTDRVLKNIRTKSRAYSPEVLRYFETNNLDTARVSAILETGDVDFDRSNTEGDPCNVYLIYDEINSETLELQIENCDSLATFKTARLVQD
ncbi:hypothetical protein [Salegentibacter sp.]|uniref:hypothetical protein n=1 Tax=Salegentibacter sp. TaxID=1903072 RepID=UPI003568772A